MSCKVVTVLKEGGEFNQRHFRWLKSQCPEIELFPLKYDFPKWWSKLEIFRPEIEGDILFFDLDTVILKPLDEFKNLNETYFLSDFFYPDKSVGSGMMYIKQCDKERVWNDFKANCGMIINSYYGDQDYLNTHFKHSRRFQHDFYGKVLSYKKHVQKTCPFYEAGYNVKDASVVCFHGKPRPWDLKMDWIPNIEQF